MLSNLKITILFRGFSFLILLYIAYGILVSLLHALYPELDTAAYKQEFIEEMFMDNPLRAFITIVFVAPIVEEMMFRTLLKPSHIELVLFLIIWPAFLLLRFIPIDVHWALKLGFTAIFLFVVTYISQQLLARHKTIKLRLWLRRHTFIIWIVTSLVFGFVHITNYVDHYTINLALFLLILPRILAGFMIGWVKMKNRDLPWAMAIHALNNGMAFCFIYLSK